MRGREPPETRFWRGIEIRGFNQIKKFLRQITLQKKPNYFSEKNFGVRCTFNFFGYLFNELFIIKYWNELLKLRDF